LELQRTLFVNKCGMLQNSRHFPYLPTYPASDICTVSHKLL
jgi:hypothetical protein